MTSQKKNANPTNAQDVAAQLTTSIASVATLPRQPIKTMEAKETGKHSYK